MKKALEIAIATVTKFCHEKFTGKLTVTFHFNSGNIPKVEVDQSEVYRLTK